MCIFSFSAIQNMQVENGLQLTTTGSRNENTKRLLTNHDHKKKEEEEERRYAVVQTIQHQGKYSMFRVPSISPGIA